MGLKIKSPVRSLFSLMDRESWQAFIMIRLLKNVFNTNNKEFPARSF